MLAFLRGRLVAVDRETVLLEVNGIGFQLQAPASTLNRLPGPGAEIKLYTHLVFREEGMALYGFWEQEELSIFRTLLEVGGVGPKAAIGLLSTLGPPQLSLAIAQGDVRLLTRAPGIGKKTAQRIIFELKDKITGEIALADTTAGPAAAGEEEDAVAALVTLGYNEIEARKAVRAVATEAAHGDFAPSGSSPEAAWLLRRALKRLTSKT